MTLPCSSSLTEAASLAAHAGKVMHGQFSSCARRAMVPLHAALEPVHWRLLRSCDAAADESRVCG